METTSPGTEIVRLLELQLVEMRSCVEILTKMHAEQQARAAAELDRFPNLDTKVESSDAAVQALELLQQRREEWESRFHRLHKAETDFRAQVVAGLDRSDNILQAILNDLRSLREWLMSTQSE